MISEDMINMLKWTPKWWRWRVYALMEMFGNYMSSVDVKLYKVAAILFSAPVLLTGLFYMAVSFYALFCMLTGYKNIMDNPVSGWVATLAVFVFTVGIFVFWVCGMQLLLNPRWKVIMVSLAVLYLIVKMREWDLNGDHRGNTLPLMLAGSLLLYPSLPRLNDAQKDIYSRVKWKYKSDPETYRRVITNFSFGTPIMEQTGEPERYEQSYGQTMRGTGSQEIIEKSPESRYQQYQQLVNEPAPNPFAEQPFLPIPESQNTVEGQAEQPFLPIPESQNTVEEQDDSFASDDGEDLWS